MPADVEFRPEGNFVSMRVYGELTAETAKGMIAQWMALEREHNCRKVLTEYRVGVGRERHGHV